MDTLSKLRLVLAGVLLGAATTIAAPTNELTREQRKAIYNEIKAQLDTEKITLEQAQKMWLEKVKHLKKEEAK